MSAASVSDSELSAWLDGEAEPERRGAIENWLHESPDAARRVEVWRRQNEMLRGRFARIVAEPAPERVWPARADQTRVVALPDAPIRLPGASGSRRARQAFATLGAFICGAAVAVLCLTATDGFRPWPLSGRATPPRIANAATNDDAIQAFARRAGEANLAFVRDATQPVDVWADDNARVAAFLSTRVGLVITPPTFERDGLRLLGGRVTPGDLGPAALLVYEEANGDRLGLLMSVAPGAEPLAPQVVERRTSAVIVWFTRGVAFVLVGPKDAERLKALQAMIDAKTPAMVSPRPR